MDEIKIEKKEVKKEKPKFWKRRVGILGKQIPVVVLLLVAVGGLGSASLLLYFGTITTTANVQQAVTLLGSPTHTIPEAAPGGESFCYLHKLDNKASVDIDVGFNIGCSKDQSPDNCGGITETIYTVPETRTLILEDKNSAWIARTGTSPKAELTFDPVNPTFKGTLTIDGLSGDYALIYYPDQADRFDPLKWNGEGGIVIKKFTTTGGHDVISLDEEIGINLPKSTDWNVNPIPDYCDLHNGFDNYTHCKGAKLWIVPTSDLTGGNSLPLIDWDPAAWLFETDLIVYSDCNETPQGYTVDMEKSALSVTTLTTKSRDKTPMLVCYDFDVAIEPGTYVITTGIKPQ